MRKKQNGGWKVSDADWFYFSFYDPSWSESTFIFFLFFIRSELIRAADFCTCLAKIRVVTRYMGSGITATGSGITSRGIRISSGDQGSGSSLGYNNQDHKILKCALIGGTCQRFLVNLLSHLDPVLICVQSRSCRIVQNPGNKIPINLEKNWCKIVQPDSF